MTLKILNKNEKEEILKMLNIQFGIKNLDGTIFTNNYEKLFIYQGSFGKEEISKIEKSTPIEKIGIYFARIETNRENEKRIRLSIEGSQMLGNQITQNTFELNDEQLHEWLKGNEILLDNTKIKPFGFVIMSYKDEFLGTGKASENKISNFIPKARRLKK
jgi:NOL1/NOP2/fmu family ribosome biogenesis protein